MSQKPSEVTTATYNWIFQRQDGVGFAATSHDKRQLLGSMTVEPDLDLRPGEILLTDKMYGSRLTFEGGLSSSALTATDLLVGRWNGAAVQLLAGDWAEGGELISLCEGALENVAVTEGKLSMSVDVLPAAARQVPCIQTSPECRAVLGDSRCRIDMRKRVHRVTVVAAGAGEIRVDAAETEGFVMGRLRWISGRNCGSEQTILSVDGPNLTLHQRPEFAVAEGDRAIVREGCDGRRATCAERFRNIQNFRGEPDLPGSEILLRFPGA